MSDQPKETKRIIHEESKGAGFDVRASTEKLTKELEELSIKQEEEKKQQEVEKKLLETNIKKVSDIARWINLDNQLKDTTHHSDIKEIEVMCDSLSFFMGANQEHLSGYLNVSQDLLEKTRKIAQAMYEASKQEIKEAYRVFRVTLEEEKKTLTEEVDQLKEKRNKTIHYLQRVYLIESSSISNIQERIELNRTMLDSLPKKTVQEIKDSIEHYKQRLSKLNIDVSYDLTNITHETSTTGMLKTAVEYKQYKDDFGKKGNEADSLMQERQNLILQLESSIVTNPTDAEEILNKKIVIGKKIIQLIEQRKSLADELYHYDLKLVEGARLIDKKIDETNEKINSLHKGPKINEKLRQMQQEIINKEKLLQKYPEKNKK